MTRPHPLLLLLALLPLAGCAGDEPPAREPLVMFSGPEGFTSFEVRDADQEILWSLVAAEAVPLSELVYGEVPAGFEQRVPVDDRQPRMLITGEPLTLESVTARRSFVHQGFVDHGERFAIDTWWMQLLEPPAAAELDGGPVPP